MNAIQPAPQPHLWDGTPMAAMPYVISKGNDTPDHRVYEGMNMSAEQSPEFRAQDIKMRRLEIAAQLAEWKRAFFVDGIEQPFTARVTLEAEDAQLALEARVISTAAVAAAVERRKIEAKAEVARLSAINAELLEALKDLTGVITAAGLSNLSRGVQLGPTVWYVKASDAMESSLAAIAKAQGEQL
ncbi:hypothetical protein F3K02_09215 [Hydrogenophaga sp. D2P1]|uniref:Uncharacterized protein n=1 Tax=Hydrogenophaga aromaticivorans TaxID=2610898 RepID=A0A7Y8GV47_9BURK|nr:hypothetical protein [Hydrogenophaga aromaticivorans]NWF45425.1 hypothetical protein [Hydrogenophaga aromaticivorans]